MFNNSIVAIVRNVGTVNQCQPTFNAFLPIALFSHLASEERLYVFVIYLLIFLLAVFKVVIAALNIPYTAIK